MSDVSDAQRPIRLEDYFTPDGETSGDFLGTLKITRTPGTTSVTVKSRKLKNCLLHWKKFLFDVLPISVGAATVIPSSAVAAAVVGLQAVKAAIDTMDVDLPAEASAVVLRLAELQRAAEAIDRGPWISVANLSEFAPDTKNELLLVLKDLERLGVVRFDLDEDHVRTVEEIRFEETGRKAGA